jgi:hypothetical protein
MENKLNQLKVDGYLGIPQTTTADIPNSGSYGYIGIDSSGELIVAGDGNVSKSNLTGGVPPGEVQSALDAASQGETVLLDPSEVYEPATPWENGGSALGSINGNLVTVKPAGDNTALIYDPGEPDSRRSGTISDIDFYTGTGYGETTALVTVDSSRYDYDASWGDPSNIDAASQWFTNCVMRSPKDDRNGTLFRMDMDTAGMGLGILNPVVFAHGYRHVHLTARGTNGSGTNDRGYANGNHFVGLFNQARDYSIYLEGDGRPVNANTFEGQWEPIFAQDSSQGLIKVESVTRGTNTPTVDGNNFRGQFWDVGNVAGPAFHGLARDGGMGTNTVVSVRSLPANQFFVNEDANGNSLPQGSGIGCFNWSSFTSVTDDRLAAVGNNSAQAGLSGANYVDQGLSVPDKFLAPRTLSYQNMMGWYAGDGDETKNAGTVGNGAFGRNGSASYDIGVGGFGGFYIIDGNDGSSGPIPVTFQTDTEWNGNEFTIWNNSSLRVDVENASGSVIAELPAGETGRFLYASYRGWHRAD